MKVTCGMMFYFTNGKTQAAQYKMDHKHFRTPYYLLGYLDAIEPIDPDLWWISMYIYGLSDEDYGRLIPDWFKQSHGVLKL